MKRIVIAWSFLLGVEATPACDGLVIERAWLRQPPPASEVAAAYFEARNPSDHEIVIQRVASPDFSGVMLHATRMVEGRVEMRPQGDIVLAPGARFSVVPGGSHVMLSGAHQRLDANASLRLELHCASGTPLAVALPVRRDAPP